MGESGASTDRVCKRRSTLGRGGHSDESSLKYSIGVIRGTFGDAYQVTGCMCLELGLAINVFKSGHLISAI